MSVWQSKQPLLLPVSSSGHGKFSCQLERLLAVLKGWLGGSLMEIKPAKGAGFLLPAAKSNAFVVQTLSGLPGCCLFSSGRLDPAGPQDCVPSSHFPPCCEVSSYPQAASAVTPTYVMLNWISRAHRCSLNYLAISSCYMESRFYFKVTFGSMSAGIWL